MKRDSFDNRELDKSFDLIFAGMNWGLIGAYDANSEGVWYWSDGSNFSYSNWDPNHFGGSQSENCSELDSGLGTWNDTPCGQFGSDGYMVF